MNIPKDLDECYEQLKEVASLDQLDQFSKLTQEELCTAHFSFGMSLRNDWGLWSGSPLKDFFKSVGVYHADDMSAIIIKSFWCNLNGKPFNLYGEAVHYHKYWQEMCGYQPDIPDTLYRNTCR
jgi:hypothetical protein